MASDKESFEAEWSTVSRSLHRFLYRRGVPEASREDIVQETALRLWRSWDKIDHSRPLVPLALVVALNLLRTGARRASSHQVLLGAVEDQAGLADTERTCLGRLEMARVGRALSQLPPAYRDILLQEVSDESLSASPSTSSAGAKMMRMRARRRLTSLLEVATAWIGLGVLRLRRSADQWASTSTAGTIAAASVLVAGFTPVPIQPPSPAIETFAPRHHELSILELSNSSVRATSADTDVLRLSNTDGVSDVSGEGHPRPEPVSVPVGDGEVTASGEAQVGSVRVQLQDNGGPVPLCVGGVDAAPDGLECAEHSD